jgi:PLD-like domain
MERFLTGDIWKEVNKLFMKGQNKIACIAYVTSDKLELSKGDTLICDASTFAIKFGETSAKTLSMYFLRGVKILSNHSLHSKLLLTDKFLIIGSANLSKNSAEKLTESSIVTDNDILISQAKVFCYNLTKESTLLTTQDIDKLLKIEVVKRPFKPTTKSKIRQKKFGDKYWFISASPFSERTYNKIKDNVEPTLAKIAERENIEEENIRFLRWRTKTKFSNLAKEGDQIILKLDNHEKTRCYIYPPSTILERNVLAGFVYFYYDSKDSEKSKIGWTKFKAGVKKIELEKPITPRTKLISKADVEKLKLLWI